MPEKGLDLRFAEAHERHAPGRSGHSWHATEECPASGRPPLPDSSHERSSSTDREAAWAVVSCVAALRFPKTAAFPDRAALHDRKTAEAGASRRAPPMFRSRVPSATDSASR